MFLLYASGRKGKRTHEYVWRCACDSAPSATGFAIDMMDLGLKTPRYFVGIRLDEDMYDIWDFIQVLLKSFCGGKLYA